MKAKQPFFLRARIKSFHYAFQGIITFFKYEHNARIHALAALCVVGLGFYMHLSISEWCWISFAIGLVIITEMLNTAVESLTDLASPEIHPLAKKTKDIAAGAVLIATLVAIVIGLLIFIPKFTP